MKKVTKVSIAEISFTLDSDAYVALRGYLDALSDHYAADPDGREIMRDIEGRVAELILGKQVYTKVVTRQTVDEIIAQLGTPEEMRGAEKTYEEDSEASIPRRLHRSREGRMIGGVCSGFAKFLDVNVAWVRLVFLAPLIIFIIAAPLDWDAVNDFAMGWLWVFVVTYCVLWIALPMAKTPRQRLEARGERITADSIRQNMQEAASTPAAKKAASVAAELFTVLGRVVLFFVKFLVGIAGFSILFGAITIFFAMLAAPFHPMFRVNGVDLAQMLEGMTIVTPWVFIELVLMCALIPLVVMAVMLLAVTFGWKIVRGFWFASIGLWIVVVALTGIVFSSNARFFYERREQWRHENLPSKPWRQHTVPGRVEIREIPPLDDSLVWQADTLSH